MSYNDEYDQEVVQELLEEMQEDSENWHRSEEDGWYYPDDGADCSGE